MGLAQGDTKLKKSGAFYIGACPFCGGRDRFNLTQKSNGWRWHCRHCANDGYKTSIDYVMRREDCTFKQALETMGGSIDLAPHPRQDPPLQLPDNPPSESWQARALQLVDRAQAVLWDARGSKALAWLRTRGLCDETIRTAKLGYIPQSYSEKPEAWGTPNDDSEPIYIHKGILIPGVIASKAWYLKIRIHNPADPKDKYRGVRGNKSASLYLADFITVDRPAVFCEGEFDALLLKQEVKDLASVITLGASTNKLNLATWGIYLLRPSSFLIAYDADEAGKLGGDDLTWLHDAQRLQVPALRKGDKDLTDFHKSGGNLYSLIESAIRPDAPIFITWQAGVNPATIRGKYRRNPDNTIEAFYLRDELDSCLLAMA
ncbi:MAG: hypothetical protein HY865_08975 [Chloroflexi bacterium]|nr:hypothetical protein [Chloroflexota bacterium]